MVFDNPADYIERCKMDSIPALPIPLVAEYLDITPAAVMGRAGRGTLELLQIGKTKMISVRSLLNRSIGTQLICDSAELATDCREARHFNDGAAMATMPVHVGPALSFSMDAP